MAWSGGAEICWQQGLGLLGSIVYSVPQPTKTHFFVGPPLNFILGFIIRTYKKVGFSSLRYKGLVGILGGRRLCRLTGSTRHTGLFIPSKKIWEFPLGGYLILPDLGVSENRGPFKGSTSFKGSIKGLGMGSFPKIGGYLILGPYTKDPTI